MDISLFRAGEPERVRECFLFRGAEQKAMRVVSDPRCELAGYGRGGTVYDLDGYRRELGLVLDGTVEARKPGGFVMTVLRPGSLFGAAAVFGGDDGYVSTLTATSECRVLLFPQPLLEDAMRADFVLAENYIRFLSGRVRYLNGLIGGLACPNAEGTLAHWLCGNLRQEGDAFFADPGVSLIVLAQMLNISRASLYRALEGLERAGLVEREGRRIRVPDPGALSRYFEKECLK